MHLYDKFNEILRIHKSFFSGFLTESYFNEFVIFENNKMFTNLDLKEIQDNSDRYIDEIVTSFVLEKDGYRLFDKICFYLEYECFKYLYFVDFINETSFMLCLFKSGDNELYYLSKFNADEIEMLSSNLFECIGIRKSLNIFSLEDNPKLIESARLNIHRVSIFCYNIIDKINASKDHFIMEVTPKKHKKERLNNTYTRKNKYRIISASKFYELKGDKEGSQKCDHYRRGHWRSFNSDRYINKKGERSWINAIWIGDSEATLNGIKYKIRLDL